MAVRECPGGDALAGYVNGTLDEVDLDVVADHVEACPACAETVCRLEQTSNSMLSRLRHPPPREECGDEEVCREVISMVAGLASSCGHYDNPSAVADAPLTGRLREYELQQLLGQGGMGAVYRARHVKLDKIVAVKVLPAARVRDERAVARFQREIRAVGRLEHPNIVRAMDAGEEAGTHFLVTELIDGRDLSNLVTENGPLSIADACEIIRQAAVGLQHVHEHGLVHRDIKPANLIVSRSGIVKLLDLGLALLDEGRIEPGEITSTGQILGTIDYMAPEQGADTHTVDIRADIFSLGATLYKLLTGQAPFAGPRYNTVMKKLSALASAAPTPVRRFRPDVSAELQSIVSGMLARQPEHRPSSPSEIAHLLEPFAAGADLVGLLEGRTARIAPRVPSANETEFSDSTSPKVNSHGERGSRTTAIGEQALQLVRANPVMSLTVAAFVVLLAALGVFHQTRDTLSREQTIAAPAVNSVQPGDVAQLLADDRVPIEIEEPPPLEEWLQGRQIITVAQDGGADYTTINAALAALQPGQVVEILDAGPYRERCEYVGMPRDIGLISRAQTIIEFGEWHQAEDGARGHVFWKLNGCRFSGLRIVYDHHPEPGMAIAFHASGSATTVLENCEFLGRGKLSHPSGGSGVYANCANGGLAVIRDCLFTGTLHVGPSRSHTSTLIRRNLFIGIDSAQVALGGFAPGVHRMIVRDNVAYCPDPPAYGLFVEPLWPDHPDQAISLSNNTIVAANHGIVVRARAPREGMQIVNNVLGREGIRLYGLSDADRQEGLTRWDVRHNAFREQPPDVTLHPATSTTFTGDVQFLSTNPADENFLRIPLDSPLVKGGAGGHLPEYIGALPPGPVPPEGDWFSRLIDRWRNAQAILEPRAEK